MKHLETILIKIKKKKETGEILLAAKKRVFLTETDQLESTCELFIDQASNGMKNMLCFGIIKKKKE